MATIRDVAREAGVSIASVSNYINDKPGLGEETAQRIAEAIDKLQYVVCNTARDLRVSSRGDIAIIFPSIAEPYLLRLFNSIKGNLQFHNMNFYLELTDAEPEKETKAIQDAIGKKASGLIIYTCQPDHEEPFRYLEKSRTPFVLIDRKPADVDCNFVSTDMEDLFYRLAKTAREKGVTEITAVLGPKQFDENRTAAAGLMKAYPQGKIIYTTASRECGFKAGITCQEMEKRPQLLLTNSYLLAEGLRYAMKIGHIDTQKRVQIVCTGDCVQDVFHDDENISKTSRATHEIGERVCKTLLDNMKSPVVFEKEHYVFQDAFQNATIRVPEKETAQETACKDTIRVLLIDEKTSSSSLSQLLSNFYGKEHIRVELVKVPPQELFQYIENYIKSGDDSLDVVMFDIPWLTYFASMGFLKPLDSYIADSHMSFSHLIPGIIEPFGKYRGSYYALPYLACVQMLFYRRDLFQSDALRRDFQRKMMIPLSRPRNWAQFNAVAKFFSKEFNQDSPVKYGHCMSISYPENLICDLMPRIWSYGANLLDQRGNVKVNERNVEKAIRNLAESVLYSTPDLFVNRPVNTVENFAAGECGMVYTYSYFAIGMENDLKTKIHHNYSVTSIPGNPVLAGWSLGIPSNSKHADAAFRFIRWASGEDIAIPQTILGSYSPNMSMYRNYDLSSLYPWLPLALADFKNAKVRRTPINKQGKVSSEKRMEDCLFKWLKPWLQTCFEQRSAEIPDLPQLLDRVQLELDEYL